MMRVPFVRAELSRLACIAMLTSGIAAVAACGGTDDDRDLPSDGDDVRFYRVIDDVLHCFHPETAEPLGLVFRDRDSWEDFWFETIICVDEKNEQPTRPPEFDWGSFVLLTVVSESGSYSGCVNELLPLVGRIYQREGVLRVLTRKPTPEELGPCDSLIQPRDVLLLDRYLDEAFPIEFSFETWDTQ